MGLHEELMKEHAAFDPYGFKSKGENSPRHAFAQQPYTFHEYPRIVYKTVDDEQMTLTVHDKEQHDKAISAGYGDTQNIAERNRHHG